MQKNNVFARSARELKSVRCLAVTALFIALNVAMDLMNIRIWITPELRLGLGFVLNASIAMLYGPTVGMMAGFCTDVMGYLVNPMGGAYFPGYTITAIVGGLLYGLWLYPRKPTRLRALGAKASVNIVCNMVLNTLWISLTGGKAMMLLLPARVAKNLLMLPLEVLLLYIVTDLVLKTYRQTQRSRAVLK